MASSVDNEASPLLLLSPMLTSTDLRDIQAEGGREGGRPTRQGDGRAIEGAIPEAAAEDIGAGMASNLLKFLD